MGNVMRWKMLLGIVIGGFLLTIYQVNPLIMDAEENHFDFPFAWLVAIRDTWGGYTLWSYHIQWLGLIDDIVLYSLITAAILYLIDFRKKEGLAEH